MRKILIVNMNYLGDALLTTPAIAAIRNANPDTVIDTVVGAGPASEVLRGNPDLNEVIPRVARGSWARCRQLYHLLRSRHYTDVVILPPLPAYAATAFFAGTKTRVGLANRSMNRFLTELRHTNAVHMADAMLDTAPVPNSARPLHRRLIVSVDDEANAAARRLLEEAGIDRERPLIAVNLGATRPQKRWFAESFALTLDQLSDLQTVLVGAGPADDALAAEVLRLTRRAKPINLVSRTSVKELAALLGMSDLLLSADSGPMHLSTAVGTPVVALFGSTDPDITGPYDEISKAIYKALPCAPCGNHPTCDARYDCLRAITPDEVALAVRSLLRDKRGSVRVTLPVADTPVTNQPAGRVTMRPRDTFKPSARTFRRILIVTKFRFIGDTLLAIPIFRAARRLWPDARIVLLTGKNARVLLQNNPYLDEIIEFDPNKTDRGQRPFWKQVGRLWSGHYDLSLILNRSFHSALMPWLAHAKTRAGFSSEGRGLLLNRPVEYDREKSEIACYFDVLRAVAPDVAPDASLELWVNDEERADAARRLAEALGDDWRSLRLAGIQPGASLEGKRWNAARFAEVADALVSSSDNLRIVLVGGPDETSSAASMLEHCTEATRQQTASFVGTCSLRGSLALLSHLNLFVGNDTAVMHSAVALGVPTVALFGPTNPRKWGNYGETRRVIESPDGSMGSIGAAPVIAAANELLTVARQSI